MEINYIFLSEINVIVLSEYSCHLGLFWRDEFEKLNNLQGPYSYKTLFKMIYRKSTKLLLFKLNSAIFLFFYQDWQERSSLHSISLDLGFSEMYILLRYYEF